MEFIIERTSAKKGAKPCENAKIKRVVVFDIRGTDAKSSNRLNIWKNIKYVTNNRIYIGEAVDLPGKVYKKCYRKYMEEKYIIDIESLGDLLNLIKKEEEDRAYISIDKNTTYSNSFYYNDKRIPVVIINDGYDIGGGDDKNE